MQKENQKILTGLKKARTHLRKVIAMLEAEEYCVSIIQQNLAVVGLLRSANEKILARHLNSCFVQAMQGTNEAKKKKMVEEILKINRLI